ncbi:fumarylacetoacetate hydrolase family protein [Thalassobaculum sp.]|uniref:fumarylacetoacetate hydrolase family protein n=1 Tax=Thalassobaculum sp. TaxID=2022740 RepID=UPI0032EAF8D7
MKLLRYGPRGQEKPGVLDASGAIRDLSGVISDLDSATLAGGDLAKLKGVDPASLPKVDGSPRIGACVGGIGKVICIGLNYSDHAAETGAAIPKEPIVFLKATSAVQGPNDDVRIPRTSKKTDWEVELGVIIGKTAKYVSEADALSHVAGYCVANDVSEREFQAERGGQWTKGKSCDTFGPIGPWFVTADEVADPQDLDMFCDVNGKRMQTGNTKTMIFPVKHIIHYLSQMMSLHPGDVIMTGTPPGVGLGIKPTPVFLKPGDEMHLGIAGLGEQTQKLVAD